MSLIAQAVDGLFSQAGDGRELLDIDRAQGFGKFRRGQHVHHYDEFVQPCKHFVGQICGIMREPPRKNRGMTEKLPRQILSDNINRMIDASTPPGATRSVRAWAISRGLDVKMIDRIAKNSHAVSLDTLEQVAKGCGLKPWHLLLEDLDWNNPPDANVTPQDLETLAKLRKLLGGQG